MRIGLITEGRTDQAVLENILEAIFEDYNPIPIRPDLSIDETDRNLRSQAALGGLSRIKNDCEEKELFKMFFSLDVDDEDFVIIQIDTAEIDYFGIDRPLKNDNENYSKELRSLAIDKIKGWLNDPNYENKIVYGISIEEIEAWILPIFENRESFLPMNPKARLKRILSRRDINSKETFENYLSLSKELKKTRGLDRACNLNESLELFVLDLKKKIE